MVYLNSDTWMTSRELVFFVLYNMAGSFENGCEIISDSAREDHEKKLAEVISSKKNGENGTERVLDNLKMPELEEIFLTVAIVSSLRETRSSAKCFRHYYALSKGKR